MKTFFKAILGVVLIGGFIGLLAYGLTHLQKPNALERVEQRLDEAAEEQKVLTENEQELKTKSENKEWEEVDKDLDK